MKLRLDRNDKIGMLKDESGVVRGLWFKEVQRARDPISVVATAQVVESFQGEKIDEEDRATLSMYSAGSLAHPVEPFEGGYAVKFLSATSVKLIRAKPWWKFW